MCPKYTDLGFCNIFVASDSTIRILKVNGSANVPSIDILDKYNNYDLSILFSRNPSALSFKY